MIEALRFRINYYLMKIEMWWSDIWMTKEEKAEIKESLRKRREAGGCSMWRQALLKNPEYAKLDWEKEFVKEIMENIIKYRI